MHKVMFISSAGGHLTEVLQISKIFDKYDYVLVTEKNSVSQKLKDKYNLEFLMSGTRNELFKYFFVCIINIILSIKLYIKYKPELIYTTGAHTAVPMCIIAHLMKKKIIYVEVYDRIDNPSLTAKILYKIADRFIVQHKSMMKVFPKSIYYGGVF